MQKWGLVSSPRAVMLGPLLGNKPKKIPCEVCGLLSQHTQASSFRITIFPVSFDYLAAAVKTVGLCTLALS